MGIWSYGVTNGTSFILLTGKVILQSVLFLAQKTVWHYIFRSRITRRGGTNKGNEFIN